MNPDEEAVRQLERERRGGMPRWHVRPANHQPIDWSEVRFLPDPDAARHRADLLGEHRTGRTA